MKFTAMKQTIGWLIPAFAAAAATWAVSDWIVHFYTFSVEPRVAGMDGRPEAPALSQEPVKLTGRLEIFDGLPSSITASWPGFRGPHRNGILEDPSFEPAESWPAEGPPQVWRIELGEGYAGAAVHNGRVYLIDYDMVNQCDAIRCFSLDDGREIWQYSYPVLVRRNHGMSRTVPAVNDNYVVTIGPKCHVTCLDAKTGQFKWMIDLVREYGTTEPLWYAGQCPLIIENHAIIAPVGKETLMMAVELETGTVRWQAPTFDRWQMTHTSILPTQFGEIDAYVYSANEGIVAVNAQDGAILWKTDAWRLRIGVASPIEAGPNRVFISGGYNKGSMMFHIEQQSDAFVPQMLYELKPEVFGSDQQTPIYYKGSIYGVRPDEQLVCMDTDGTIRWTSGQENRYGLGPYIIVNGLIYILTDEGVLSLIRATADRFERLTQAKVLDGHESWGPPAFAAGRLIVRDLTTMVCLDVSAP